MLETKELYHKLEATTRPSEAEFFNKPKNRKISVSLQLPRSNKRNTEVIQNFKTVNDGSYICTNLTSRENEKQEDSLNVHVVPTKRKIRGKYFSSSSSAFSSVFDYISPDLSKSKTSIITRSSSLPSLNLDSRIMKSPPLSKLTSTSFYHTEESHDESVHEMLDMQFYQKAVKFLPISRSVQLRSAVGTTLNNSQQRDTHSRARIKVNKDRTRSEYNLRGAYLTNQNYENQNTSTYNRWGSQALTDFAKLKKPYLPTSRYPMRNLVGTKSIIHSKKSSPNRSLKEREKDYPRDLEEKQKIRFSYMAGGPPMDECSWPMTEPQAVISYRPSWVRTKVKSIGRKASQSMGIEAYTFPDTWNDSTKILAGTVLQNRGFWVCG